MSLAASLSALTFDQDRSDQAAQRSVHGDSHAVAHKPHRISNRNFIRRIEPGYRRKHHDETDDRTKQSKLHETIACEATEIIGAPQCIRQPSKKQRLVQPVMALTFRFQDQVPNVACNKARRKPRAPDRFNDIADHLKVFDAGPENRIQAQSLIRLL